MTATNYLTAPDRTPVDELRDGPGVSHIDPNDPAAPTYEFLARIRTPLTLRDMMIQEVRAGYIGQDHEVDPRILPPPPERLFPQVGVRQIYVPSPDGPIRCQLYTPGQAAGGGKRLGMVIYAHGGGFMVGRSEDTDFVTRKICALAGVVVISVNYRLAPEFPFPVGLEDCMVVYRWARRYGEELGGDPERVGVAGDSSGGNFAAAMPLRARDEGSAMPNASVMLGPVCDFAFEQYESFRRLAPLGVVYDAAFAGFMRGAYVRYEDWSSPHVSPICGNLKGYPPALIVVGTEDPMVDSACAFAQKLLDAGDMHVCQYVPEGMPHGFYFTPGLYPQEEHAFTQLAEFLTRYLK